MSGRILQWQYSAAKLRDQTRQSALARCAGGVGLETGPFPAQLQSSGQMAADPGQRSSCHWRRTQKSHRGRGAAVSDRSVARAHRALQTRGPRSGNLVVREEQKGKPPNEKPKTTLERGRCPLPNLLRKPFACVGLDWARPCSSSTDRIDQIAAVATVTCTDRSKSRWKINQRAKTGRGSAPEETSTSTNKPYELTSHLHPRPPYLTSYIGVRPSRLVQVSMVWCQSARRSARV